MWFMYAWYQWNCDCKTNTLFILKIWRRKIYFLLINKKFSFAEGLTLDQIKMNDDVKIEDSTEKDLNSEDNIAIKASDVKLSEDTIIDSAEVKQDDSSIFKELYDQGRDS